MSRSHADPVRDGDSGFDGAVWLGRAGVSNPITTPAIVAWTPDSYTTNHSANTHDHQERRVGHTRAVHHGDEQRDRHATNRSSGSRPSE